MLQKYQLLEGTLAKQNTLGIVYWSLEHHEPWILGLATPSLPLGLALGSPIFPSGCEGKLGAALESLQGLRDLT